MKELSVICPLEGDVVGVDPFRPCQQSIEITEVDPNGWTENRGQ
jgi:hypothetical protein